MTCHTSWITVDISALKHNLAQVKDLVGEAVKVMCVVKADAYGHGVAEASLAFESAGADYLAVTTLEEGLEIRRAGVAVPVLIFSPLLPDQIGAAIENDLDQTICATDFLGDISATAERLGKTARVHVKIDTGMGRLGVFPRAAAEFMRTLKEHGSIEVAGTYTHFANAACADLVSARQQNSTFAETLEVIRGGGFDTGLAHASNSAAILNMPEARYDMVRPGTVLYGQRPCKGSAAALDLKNTWSLRTRVVALRQLPAGTHVGYGSEFTTRKPMTVAVIPVGYGDGFAMIPESVARRNANPFKCIAETVLGRTLGPRVTIRSRKCPIVGRISMQMSSVDVTAIPNVELGDEVIVPARRVTISARIPKMYES